ncbi:MAG: hypothetical protein FWG22_01130 [Prolixibacteraceae bacterium]|nr:hypothetical protein [Prolixibacteraceae bacterium]
MEKHINFVAWLFIGLGILSIVTAIFVGVFFGIFARFIPGSITHGLLNILITIAIWMIVLLSVPGIIAGVGLLNRKEWARILTIILAALKVLNFPFGTCIGIYSIWALSNDEVAYVFRNGQTRQLR